MVDITPEPRDKGCMLCPGVYNVVMERVVYQLGIGLGLFNWKLEVLVPFLAVKSE